MALHESEKNYKVPEERSAYIRQQVESRIASMVNVVDITERNAVRTLWNDAQIFRDPHQITDEAVGRALSIAVSEDEGIPELIKVTSMIRLCQASLSLPEEKSGAIWNTFSRSLERETDDFRYMVRMGSWLVGAGVRSIDDYFKAIHGLDDKTNERNRELRFGIQIAAARLSELVHAGKFRMGIYSVMITSLYSEQEHRSSHGILGYPDTMMILPKYKLPSLRKLQEAAVIGVPDSQILKTRSLMAMIGVEESLQSRESHEVHQYSAKRWSFVSVGALRNPADRTSAYMFVPDALTLWVAVRTSERIGTGASVPEHILVGEIKKTIRMLTDEIGGVYDVRLKQTVRVPGVFDTAYSEYRAKNGSDEAEEKQAIRIRLQDSVRILLSATGGQSGQGIRMPEREAITDGFTDIAWSLLSEDDKWSFVKIIFHPQSGAWNMIKQKSAISALVSKIELNFSVTIPPDVRDDIFEITRRRVSLKWETIRDKEGVNALLWFG